MCSIWKTYSDTSLILRIVVGLVIGAVLGVTMPQQAEVVTILGSVFVGALKGVAPVLVFILVMASLMRAAQGIGARFKTAVLLYVVSTLLAATVAVFASELFPVNMQLNVTAATQAAPEGIGQVLKTLITNCVANPVAAVMNANYIGILFWAILLGLAFKKHATDETKAVFDHAAESVSQVVRWIINMAPFGIMGLVFDSVATSGLGIFTTYGKLLAVLVGCMLFVALVVDPLLVFLFLRRNPFPLVFRCLRESGVTAFFTRSSAANIPVNMQLCEKLGLDKDVYSVTIPLGATINMDGAAITISVMTLAVANTLGISVDLPTALVLSVLSTLAACGASGVAGGSLLLIPMACSLFGISNDIAMQAVGVGFIIGVVQDSVETALNSAGDVMFAATAEFYDRMQRGEKIDF